jgi:hypothetical protein
VWATSRNYTKETISHEGHDDEDLEKIIAELFKCSEVDLKRLEENAYDIFTPLSTPLKRKRLYDDNPQVEDNRTAACHCEIDSITTIR